MPPWPPPSGAPHLLQIASCSAFLCQYVNAPSSRPPYQARAPQITNRWRCATNTLLRSTLSSLTAQLYWAAPPWPRASGIRASEIILAFAGSVFRRWPYSNCHFGTEDGEAARVQTKSMVAWSAPSGRLLRGRGDRPGRQLKFSFFAAFITIIITWHEV